MTIYIKKSFPANVDGISSTVTYYAGQIVDLPDSQEADLVRQNVAEYYDKFKEYSQPYEFVNEPGFSQITEIRGPSEFKSKLTKYESNAYQNATNKSAFAFRGDNNVTLNVTSPQGRTYYYAVPVASDVTALRVVVANRLPADTFVVTGATVAASLDRSDFVNPTGGDTFKYFTFNNMGLDGPNADYPYDLALVKPADQTIPSNTTFGPTGAIDLPKRYFSDWNWVETMAPDSNGIRWLFVRVHIAQTTTATGFIPTGLGFRDDPVANRGFAFSVKRKTANELVTNPTTGTIDATDGIVCEFQFMTAKKAIQVYNMGDSFSAGATSIGDFNSFLTKVTLRATTETNVLFMNRCLAAGGTDPVYFVPAFTEGIKSNPGGIALLQGWSGNYSINTNFEMKKYLNWLKLCAKRMIEAGGSVLITTPIPKGDGYFTVDPQRLVYWKLIRQELLALRSPDLGIEVVDVTPLLGNVETGLYFPENTTDDIHPNDRGHQVIADAIYPAFLRLAGV